MKTIYEDDRHIIPEYVLNMTREERLAEISRLEEESQETHRRLRLKESVKTGRRETA